MIRKILEKAGSPAGAPAAVTLAYVLIAGLAILLSGSLVGLWVDDPIRMTRVVLLKDGVYVGVTAVFLYLLLRRAMTYLMRARDANAASRDFHLPVFERLRIPVWRSAPDGRWDFVNRSWLALAGREAHEELGRGWQAGILEEEREDVVRRYIAAVAARRPFALECRIRTAGGQTRWVTHYGAPFNDLEGNFAGHLGFCRDVSDRRSRDAEAFTARTLESIGTLAGRIAHDFNNLLTAVLGNVSLARILARQGRSEEIDQRLREAEEACGRAQAVARELLTFADGGTPVRRPASLQEVIRKAACDVSGGEEECEFRLQDDLLPVEIDEVQIRQVIANVVRNAREASPQGGAVTVAAENVAVREDDDLPLRAGNYVRIDVADRGMGISEKDLPRIFDPFFTTKEKGTGLGLSISYSIVKRHEGYITARSGEGEGTTFRIYLPSAVRLPAPPPPSRRAEGGAGPRRRILLLEDEAIVRDVVRRMVEQLGCDVTAVPDGKEAVAAYRTALGGGDPFAAVILDLTVAGGQGAEECLRELRSLDPGVRAIVSSGYVNDPVMKEHARFGFGAAIAKPYDVDAIRGALASVLPER